MDRVFVIALAIIVLWLLYFLFRRKIWVGRCFWCKHSVWGWQPHDYHLDTYHGEKKLEHLYIRDCNPSVP